MQNLTLDLTQTFSEKEQTIYGLLCQNLTNEEIAEKLQMSISGVKYHLIHIYKKLGVETDGKKFVTIARARAISYGGTKIVQTYQSKEDKFGKENVFSREEILSFASKLTWYDQTRVSEILDDLFRIMDSDQWSDMTTGVSKKQFNGSPVENRKYSR